MAALELDLTRTGILFDSDGVLVDSDATVERAWTTWAEHYGLEPSAVLRKVHGHPARETVAELLDPPHRADALALVNRLELQEAASVRAMPGAVELLASLPSSTWAVVTSGIGALARARLEAAGFPSIGHLVTADDVARGKPEPEPYLAGARALGIPAERCVVFEDAVVGVLAARAAGVLAVVAVGRETATADVDAFVPDLSAVRYDGMLHVPDGRPGRATGSRTGGARE
ncbi:MAG: mannitol-/sugar-/sorbitol-6-phosphatase [Nocardioidaceae bacterium]|nr:mannitol-/sugar-/sorbitol-6-phosphatase [Nocardioidaceae bacterium]